MVLFTIVKEVKDSNANTNTNTNTKTNTNINTNTNKVSKEIGWGMRQVSPGRPRVGLMRSLTEYGMYCTILWYALYYGMYYTTGTVW